jgi:hypothetical protein
MSATDEQLLVPYDKARKKLGGIGKTMFYELIEQKKLVRVALGRRVFVTADSLERYVDSLTKASVGKQLALFDLPDSRDEETAQ